CLGYPAGPEAKGVGLFDLKDHPDATVRAWLFRTSPSSWRRSLLGAHREARYREDRAPEVQLQLAVASRESEVDPLLILLEVLNNCGSDKLIPHIVWQNLHPLLEERSGDFLNQVAKLDLEKSPNVLNLMPRVVDRVLAAKKKDPEALASLVTVLASSPSSRE